MLDSQTFFLSLNLPYNHLKNIQTVFFFLNLSEHIDFHKLTLIVDPKLILFLLNKV